MSIRYVGIEGKPHQLAANNVTHHKRELLFQAGMKLPKKRYRRNCCNLEVLQLATIYSGNFSHKR